VNVASRPRGSQSWLFAGRAVFSTTVLPLIQRPAAATGSDAGSSRYGTPIFGKLDDLAGGGAIYLLFSRLVVVVFGG